MVWVKIDDTEPEDPVWNADRAGPLGLALQVAAKAYCNRQLTDGTITRSAARRLLDVDDAVPIIDALVREGVWTTDDGGRKFAIVGYLDAQPSAEKVRADRQRGADRQARWRERKAMHAAGDHGKCLPDDACRRRSSEPTPIRGRARRGAVDDVEPFVPPVVEGGVEVEWGEGWDALTDGDAGGVTR